MRAYRRNFDETKYISFFDKNWGIARDLGKS